jgi:hydrogenase nickel incorporation protein HypA/HybF
MIAFTADFNLKDSFSESTFTLLFEVTKNYRNTSEMHEFAVTQSILDIAVKTAEENGNGRVLKIYLNIGQLSSIIDDSVQFIFDFLSKGTRADGAKLCMNRIPAKVWCCDCCAVSHQNLPITTECPACGSSGLVMYGGDEFHIESIELENEDSGCN